MTLDDSGWLWMTLNDSGWLWMTLDESGWLWMTPTPDDFIFGRLQLRTTPTSVNSNSGRLRTTAYDCNSARHQATPDDSGRLWAILDDSGLTIQSRFRNFQSRIGVNSRFLHNFTHHWSEHTKKNGLNVRQIIALWLMVYLCVCVEYRCCYLILYVRFAKKKLIKPPLTKISSLKGNKGNESVCARNPWPLILSHTWRVWS